jgi:DNA topoisomerase-1
MRLRRSSPSDPGYGRRRHGRSFTYLDADGTPLTDAAEVDRCRSLVIPPAWNDVWICTDPAGHLQATGVDSAGRRQYLYHPDWRARRDRNKFVHVREVAGRLPRLRRRVTSDLADPDLSRRRVLALAARLIDKGLFRVGSDEYPTYGIATIEARHVTAGHGVRFCFEAKGGVHWELKIMDRAVRAAISELVRVRHGTDRLLAFHGGNGWQEVHADEINEYLRDAAGIDMSAKDFRTWHATVTAAIAFARAKPATTKTGIQRTIAAVMRDVSEDLGNTPAVARKSYVDPLVVERYRRGETIALPKASSTVGPATERAVLELLD